MIFFLLFGNGHFHNVALTLPNVENDNVVSALSNVAHINVEIHNIDSILLDVVNSNDDIHNVISMLICRCRMS